MASAGAQKTEVAKAKAEAPKASSAAAAAPSTASPAVKASPVAADVPVAAKAPAEVLAVPKAQAPAVDEPQLTVRPEVKASIKVLSAEAAKPKAEAKPAGVAGAAVLKEKVKAEKPKAGPQQGEVIDVIPAQTPSPSVVGIAAVPPKAAVTATQVASPDSNATWRTAPAAETAALPAETAPRQPVAQVVGSAPGANAVAPPVVAAAAAKAAGAYPVPVPPQAVEVVSRQPVPATVSLPPTAAPLPTDLPATGTASALSSIGQAALKAAAPPPPVAARAAAPAAAPAPAPTPTPAATPAAAPAATPAPAPAPTSAAAPAAVRAAAPVAPSPSPTAAAPKASGVPPQPAPAPAAAPGAAAPAAAGAPTAAPVPQDGPPAVALGRAAVRGSNPVLSRKEGKPATDIAKRYQIVFVSSEVAPWSKTGGLGEAMDGLPVALAALGHRVMTIAPRYDQYEEGWDTGYWSHVPMGSTAEPVHAFHAFQSKVDRVFIDHDCFLNKVPKKSGAMLYGPDWGKDFADNQWRFMYFAKAALKIIQELPLGGFPYGAQTIVVVNDWHSSLVPVYLHMQRKALPELWDGTKSALLIHNSVFQGRFDRDDPEEPAFDVYGLPEVVMSTFTFKMSLKVGRTEPQVKRCINWMASAAKYVDRILTVSPTYAWELINLPEMGVELDGIFGTKGVTGIVNGVKEAVNPMNPAFVTKAKMPSTFGVMDVDEKKAELKAQIQEQYGLPVSAETPLCIFVGRMDLQKGYDYLLAALDAVLDTVNLQLIIIGTGRADLVSSTKALAKKHPEKIYPAGWCGPERYAIVAGADYNLMPSRWEPCGLAQMESMRFGTLPVVAQTGGLVDTVQDMVTGLHLAGAVSVEKELDPSSVEIMAQALERVVEVHADTAKVSEMRKAAMAAGAEFTWSNASLQYEAVFEEMGAVDVGPLCDDLRVTLESDKVVA